MCVTKLYFPFLKKNKKRETDRQGWRRRERVQKGGKGGEEKRKGEEGDRWKYNDARNAERFGRPLEKMRKVKYAEWKGKYAIFLDGRVGGNT